MREFVFNPARIFSVSKGILGTLFLTLGIVPVVRAQVTTTTTLSIPTPSVAAGVPTLLTATVTDAASHRVTLGTVTFYDGARSLGSAQIVSGASGAYPQGTANLKTASFGVGTNSITAVFAGTKGGLKSTSAAKTVIVTGGSKTATALNGGAVGSNYYLNAELESFGQGTPTGSLDFMHGTSSIDTKPLSEAKWKSDLIRGPAAATDANGRNLAAADFNGDGFLDVATADYVNGSPTFPNVVDVLLGKGDGSFHPAVSYPVTGSFPYGVYAGDFNNDGRPDLALLNTVARVCNETTCITTSPSLGIMLGNGDGSFKPQILNEAQPNQSEVTGLTSAFVGDFNRDGSLDIAMVHTYIDSESSGEIDVLLGNGDGTFQAPISYPVGANPEEIVGGDLNGDGIIDFVVNTDQGQSVLLGRGDGSFFPQNVYSLSGNGGIALGDLNHDGKLDLVMQNDSGCCYSTTVGTISVALGKGDGTFATPLRILTPEVLDLDSRPLLVDFNQDGNTDLVIENDDYAGNHIAVFLGNGDGTFQPPTAYLESVSPNLEVVGDFNGDGRPDIVGANFPDGSVFTMLNGQTTNLQIARGGLGAGTTTIDAIYSGDAAFSGSTSKPVYLGQGAVDFSGGFSGAKTGLTLNNGAAVVSGKLQLTDGGLHEATSAYSAMPISVSAFQTDFTFQILNPAGDGFIFTIQNANPTALGRSGGGLGYQGIQKSVAIKFDINSNAGETNDSIGLYTDGAAPTLPATDLTFSSIQLRSGHPFQAHVSYDSTRIVLTLTDTVTQLTASWNWPIDIVATIGGSSAYVGFTAGTSSASSTTTINSWRYLAGMPPPSYPSATPASFYPTPNLVLNGSANFGRFFQGNLSVTNGDIDQAGSAFYAIPQNIQSFITDFQIVQGGDGMTFTIQNDGPNALGGIGGGLGYEGITKSVAIKFDLYNNDGEGNNSIGLYVDGAPPTVPAVDLGSFPQTQIFEGHVTYDGKILTLTLTSSPSTFTYSWPIDIPATVGGPTAYVGFTSGTGSSRFDASLWYWTYQPGVN